MEGNNCKDRSRLQIYDPLWQQEVYHQTEAVNIIMEDIKELIITEDV